MVVSSFPQRINTALCEKVLNLFFVRKREWDEKRPKTGSRAKKCFEFRVIRSLKRCDTEMRLKCSKNFVQTIARNMYKCTTAAQYGKGETEQAREEGEECPQCGDEDAKLFNTN